MVEKCVNCGSKIFYHTDFCLNCGYFFEKEYHQPLQTLCWGSY